MISWNNIVLRFQQRFSEAYYSGNKKAHFDFVPIECAVIDGARGKWCSILLFNALIGQLDTTIQQSAIRRKFNQRLVLKQCIQDEIKSVNGTKISDVTQVSVESPWDTTDNLFSFLRAKAPYKSRQKFDVIVEVLKQHSVMQRYQSDLHGLVTHIIMLVVHELECTKTLTTLYTGKTFKRTSREPTLTPAKPEKKRHRDMTGSSNQEAADATQVKKYKRGAPPALIADDSSRSYCTPSISPKNKTTATPPRLFVGHGTTDEKQQEIERMQRMLFCGGLFMPIAPTNRSLEAATIENWDILLQDDSTFDLELDLEADHLIAAPVESSIQVSEEKAEQPSPSTRVWKPFPDMNTHRVYKERNDFVAAD